MAVDKMSTLTVFVLICALAGLCYGQREDCSHLNPDVILPKVAACVAKKASLSSMFDIFTVMKKPKSMENADFMCREQEMMVHVIECTLQYVEGCMPPKLAGRIAQVVPTHDSIKKGIGFFCKHRKAFEDACVKTHLMATVSLCINPKMQGIVQNSSSAFCSALEVEERCIDSGLRECPREATASVKSTLRAFFPESTCQADRLLFQSEHVH